MSKQNPLQTLVDESPEVQAYAVFIQSSSGLKGVSRFLGPALEAYDKS